MSDGLDRLPERGDDPENAGQSSGESVAAILLAEDDEAVREFVKRALAHYGHNVTAVGDGGSALAALEDAPYDLLLTDYNLRGMTGVVLMQTLRGEGVCVPMVLFTAYDTPRIRKEAQQAGVAAFIPKPFFLDEFVSMTRGLLPIKSSEMGS